MNRRASRILGVVVAAAFLSLPAVTAAAQDTDPLIRDAYLFELTGAVDPLVAGAVERAVRTAEAANLPLLIRIDTPGGLDSSMRRIVKAVVNADIDVVCWVGPDGARAASAGAFILMGCPTATMASGTNVGAAHPVGFRGDVLNDKVTNDAAAYIRALAERWNRNADWAEQAVRNSVSIPAEEALAIDVIDRIAGDVDAALGFPARTRTVRLTIAEAIFHTLIDPNLAFLLFVFGIGLIAFEFISPGGVGGVIGALLLIASLVMLGMLPVNLAGALLIVAAMILFVVEAHTPGIGAAGAAGLTALVLGGLFLFDASVPNARVSRAVVATTAIAAAVFFTIAAQAVLKARRMPVTAGISAAAGTEGIVVRDLGPGGVVAAAGEEWSAESISGPIPAGRTVRVVRVDGLTLIVEPVAAEQEHPLERTEGET